VKILITGITGRVGRSLARHMRSHGHEIRGLAIPVDVASGATHGIEAEIVEGDLGDTAALEKSVKGVDAIVHLAALMAWGDRERDGELFHSNLTGTFRLLEAATRGSRRLKRFVMASSDEVYPSLGAAYLPIDEEHPLRPQSFYGMTKQADEEMVRYYQRAHGLPISIARFALVTQPHEVLAPDGWLGRFLYLDAMLPLIASRAGAEAAKQLEDLRSGDRTLLLARDADGVPYTFHYCDVRDLVEGLELLVTNPAAIGEAFNLAGPAPFSYDQAVGYLAEKTGYPVADARIPGPALHIRHSTAKARSLLGYAPRYGIRETIDAAFDHE